MVLNDPFRRSHAYTAFLGPLNPFKWLLEVRISICVCLWLRYRKNGWSIGQDWKLKLRFQLVLVYSGGHQKWQKLLFFLNPRFNDFFLLFSKFLGLSDTYNRERLINCELEPYWGTDGHESVSFRSYIGLLLKNSIFRGVWRFFQK